MQSSSRFAGSLILEDRALWESFSSLLGIGPSPEVHFGSHFRHFWLLLEPLRCTLGVIFVTFRSFWRLLGSPLPTMGANGETWGSQ